MCFSFISSYFANAIYRNIFLYSAQMDIKMWQKQSRRTFNKSARILFAEFKLFLLENKMYKRSGLHIFFLFLCWLKNFSDSVYGISSSRAAIKQPMYSPIMWYSCGHKHTQPMYSPGVNTTPNTRAIPSPYGSFMPSKARHIHPIAVVISGPRYLQTT